MLIGFLPVYFLYNLGRVYSKAQGNILEAATPQYMGFNTNIL